MKNYRNGVNDVSPPIQHRDLRPCWTLIGFGGRAIVIGPGPGLHLHPSNYRADNQ
jgi:hypothetical protein